MAIVKSDATTKLVLSVRTDELSKAGNLIIRQRTFGNIKDTISDETLHTLGTDLKGLQRFQVEGIYRNDSAKLVVEV